MECLIWCLICRLRGSTLTKSPITTWSFRWAGLHWKKERSDAGNIEAGWSRKWREDESKKVEYEGKYVRSLYPLHYFCGHTWIHLNRCNVFRLFENLDGEVSSTRADFQHFFCRFQICLNRASTMRNSELPGHSFKRITPTNLPYMSNTPRSRNRCISLACLGVFENVLAETSSVEDWIGYLCIVRCRLGSLLMYTRKYIWLQIKL